MRGLCGRLFWGEGGCVGGCFGVRGLCGRLFWGEGVVWVVVLG